MNRRQFLTAAAAGAGLATASACGARSSGGAASGAGDGGAWRRTDDLGATISLPRRPRRIVAYVSGAAALWDFGVRPVAVYGPARNDDGSRNLLAGNLDVDAVASVGDGYTDFDLEKLAAQRPDLVLASLNGTTAASRWVIKDTVAKRIEQIAPIYSIQESGKPLPDVITAYQDLSRSLGADVEAADVSRARDAFGRAGAALRTALQAKPDLRAQFVYADDSGMYVASPKFYSTLIWYRSLGLSIARQDDPSAQFLQQLSWEQVTRYPADLVLTDIRSFSLPQKQIIAEHPTFARLPAVRAGQLGGWNGEPRFSYQQAIAEVQNLTAAVRDAQRL